MMKKNINTILLAALFIVLPLAAEGGVEFSGEVQTIWGAGAPWTDSETSAGKFLLGTTEFTGTLDAYYDNSSAFAEAAVSYDAVTNELDWSLNELWLDYTSSFWGIRIGRQKTAWGKADGVDITNVICPSDMSSLSAMTSDDSKLAVDAIRLSLSKNQFTADAYWIPFFTPAALPAETAAAVQLEKPEISLWNGEYGIKLSGYFSALDVSFYGFYGWDDMPFISYEPVIAGGQLVGMNVKGNYKRMTMFGLDAAVPVREVVFRAEAAFFPQRYFSSSTPAMSSTEEQRNEISALAGLDWMPEGWTLTAQYFCDYVMGDLEPLEREDAYTHGATLSVSKTFLNETLKTSFSGMMHFNDFDSVLKTSINYSLSDQINLEGGAYIFIPGPDEDGVFGAYKDYSAFYIKAKFSF